MIDRMRNLRGAFFAATSSVLCCAGCERLEVTVVRVDRGAVESTVTSVEAGIIEPRHKAKLASPVAGRIVKVYHKEGDRVAPGEPLFELENDTERLRVDESARELKRLESLKDDVASAELYDRADFAYRRAKVDYERTIVRATFPGVVADVNARVGEMTFGSMAAMTITSGKASQEPLIYVVDDSQLHVEADIDESDVAKVRIGQPAKVTLGGLDRTPILARVSSISPTVSTDEGESRTAEVHAELLLQGEAPSDGASPSSSAGSGPTLGVETPPAGPASPDTSQPILVGMSADIEILVEKVHDVVRVPTLALLEHGSEKHVFVLEGDVLRRKPIEVGIGNWDMTEVRSGLSAGDMVVIPTDAKELIDGRKVKSHLVESAHPAH